jgi:adenylate kinase family enzyme
MLVIAGPPGSGKSTFRPVPTSPYDAFNLDERRALCRARHKAHYAERQIIPTGLV